jgi:outer membrane receptor protein involved in Fe transport
MNPTLKRMPLALVTALAVAATPLVRGQVAAQPNAPEPEEEATVVLSPFVVETSQDEGKYRATETLGGARIRTSLKDIASPFSVVTAQFLQDTASNNNQDLLTYTTNTEVGGLIGNYGGFGNSQGVSDRTTLLSPNNNTRVRGLDQADNTRNFFLSDIPWDSYNVERVEIQRGPNSILFGVGSPAGIINTNTIQARFDGNRGKIENQFSKFDSVRWVADYNLEVIDDLLAVRVAGLDSNQNFRQKPAFNDDRRGYATATFQPQVLPKEWAGKLVIRGTYERASITANRPRILPPEDGISLWFEDAAGDGVSDRIGFGKRVYDPYLWSQGGGGDITRGTHAGVSGTVANPLPYQPAVTAIDGGALNNGGIGFFYKNGESRPFFTSRQSPRAFPGGLAANGSVDNTVTGILYATLLRVGGLNSYAVSIDKIDELEGRPSRFPLATRGYYKDQSMTDRTIFDFYNNLIDGDNKRERQKWDASNFSLAQTFLNNRLGVELVYDQQSYSEWREGSTWNRPYISIDINKNQQHQLSRYSRTSDNLLDTSSYSVPGFTPSAQQPYANPMAGAAFVAGSFERNNRHDRDRENKRLTVFGELRAADFFDRESLLTRILGRHTFTGLLSKEDRSEAVTQWVPSAVPYDWAYSLSISGENTALGEAPRGITPVIYLSDPLFDRTSASGLNLGAMQTYYNPSGVYSVDYFKTQWLPSRNPGDPSYVDPAAPWTNLLGETNGVQAENPANYTGRTKAQVTMLSADSGDFDQLVTNYGVTEQTIDSKGLVWQGHLLGGTIVPTVGWREDKLVTYTATGAKDEETGIASRRVGDTERVLENTGRTTSWGLVAHMPSRWIENIPVLSGISAYYNYGENNRVEARYNYDGEPLENPSAKSKDYGVVLSLLDDKLSIKVGKYETKVKSANLPGGSSILGSNQYYLYQLEAWGTANTLLYAFGRAGLDPNQNWHWNQAMVDDNAWGNSDYDPHTDLFKNHPSSVRQLAAMDAWMANIDEKFFSNYAINANVPALKTAYQTWRTSGNIQPLVDAARGSGFNVGTYTTGFSSQNNGQIKGISPNGAIDNTSEGYEIEIDYTPLPNWNIKINAAKTTAYREALGAPMLEFIEQQWSKLQGPAGDLRLWWGGDNTLRRYYSDNIISAVEFQKESVGFNVPELRPWRFGAITNYAFNEGRLRGFNVGGAYRWEDKQILGYGLKSDSSGLDVRKPIYGEKEDHIDLWAGYQRKISEKIAWRIQINLRNVGESVGLTPISVNPDGIIAARRITEGMTWSVTNSFLF